MRKVAILRQEEEQGIPGHLFPNRTKVPHLAADGKLFSPKNQDRAFNQNSFTLLILDDVLGTSAVKPRARPQAENSPHIFRNFFAREELRIIAPTGKDVPELRGEVYRNVR